MLVSELLTHEQNLRSILEQVESQVSDLLSSILLPQHHHQEVNSFPSIPMVILYFQMLVTVVRSIFLEPIQMHETIRLQEYGEMAECLYENEFPHDLHIIDIMGLLVIFERTQTCFLFQILVSLVQVSMCPMVVVEIFSQCLQLRQVVI